jgi:HAD superfamily hydrolase (TIGR01509 family)
VIKVVCFDLGGVLVRITTDMAEAAQRAGVVVNGSPGSFLDFPPFIDFQAGRLSESAYLGELSALLGVDPAQALAAHNHILVEPYPGTLEFIETLEAVGVICGCLSNTNAPHWQEMRQGTRFPNVSRLRIAVASHEHQMEKPHAAIFDRFRELAGWPDPNEVAFFDDTRVNVEAARALGWRAWSIDPARDTARQMNAAIASLSESS